MKLDAVADRAPELALVALAARRTLDESARQRFHELTESSLDWRRVLAKAHWHGIIPLLVRHLETAPNSTCPSDIWQELRAHAVGVALTNKQFLRRLAELGDAMHSAGIPVVSLKGPVLAFRAFGDESLRVSSDLDVLRACPITLF
ncbi:MAG: nucleotidyltransferase family protein, partial [Planctomycetales bacterium]|nr:nucleotidyltransferase family protein [Planctomycetales bacterium]